MARVMAVSFTTYGRLYYLDPGAVTYAIGDRVLHPTEAGPEVATVVWAPEQVDSEKLTGLPLCPGPAIEADLARDAANRRRVAEIEGVVRGLVERHQLAMKVVGVDLDDRSPEFGTLVAVYYTAPHRVDFRALLSDLARSLRSRIDLRQIGARDAARISGGLGSCGRELCCATFLTDFEPVSVRLARAQDLPANPLQVRAPALRRLRCPRPCGGSGGDHAGRRRGRRGAQRALAVGAGEGQRGRGGPLPAAVGLRAPPQPRWSVTVQPSSLSPAKASLES